MDLLIPFLMLFPVPVRRESPTDKCVWLGIRMSFYQKSNGALNMVVVHILDRKSKCLLSSGRFALLVSQDAFPPEISSPSPQTLFATTL